SWYSTREELLALGSALGEAGAGVYQMSTRTLKDGLHEDERAFLEEMSRSTGRPVTLNGLDHRNPNCPAWLDWLAGAAARGARLRSNAQVMLISAENRFAFNAAGQVTQPFPLLSELAQSTPAAALERLRDPATRAAVKADL